MSLKGRALSSVWTHTPSVVLPVRLPVRTINGSDIRHWRVCKGHRAQMSCHHGIVFLASVNGSVTVEVLANV